MYHAFRNCESYIDFKCEFAICIFQFQAFEELKTTIGEQLGNLNRICEQGIPVQTMAVSNPHTTAEPPQPSTARTSDVEDMDIEKLDLIEGHLDTIRTDMGKDGVYDFADMRAVLGRIESGVHDIKMYHAPPVEDAAEASRDGPVTRYKIGDHILPLSSVQEIFDLEEALKEDLVRSGNNLDVATFYMSLVSKNIFFHSFLYFIVLNAFFVE